MYGLFNRGSIRDLTPEEVPEGLAADKITPVAVRAGIGGAAER
jgi:hypothetical protein